MKRYTGKELREELNRSNWYDCTEFIKADDVKQLLSDIYWQTTCDMTRQYLQNKTDIDFKKELKK